MQQGVRSLVRQTPLEQYRGYLLGWRQNKLSTFERYLHDLRFLEQASGKPFLSDTVSVRLDHHDVMAAVIANPDKAPETQACIVKAAKSWEKAGEQLGWWKANGLLNLSFPKPKPELKPSLTDRQVQALLGVCRTAREWRVVALGLYAGMRVSDSTALRERDWHEDRIRYTARKTGNKVEVPIHLELAGLKRVICNDYPEGEVLKMTARRLRDRVDFYFTTNTLRATFTQRLLDLGVPLWVVKDLRGDAPKEVVFTNYAVVPFPDKQGAISTLDYGA